MTQKQNLTWHGLMHECILHDREGGRLSNQMLTLACECEDVVKFLAKCAETENYYRQPERGQDQITGPLPDAWTQAKSDIKSAWLLGLKPTDYETMSSYRKAKAAANKGENPDHFKRGGGGVPAAEAERKAKAEVAKAQAKAAESKPEATPSETPEAEKTEVNEATAKIVNRLSRAILLISRLPDTEQAKVCNDILSLVQSRHDTFFNNRAKPGTSQPKAA